MAESQDSSTKQLCCPICLEPFDSLKSLPCMHTFCEKCICKHASDLSVDDAQSAVISCPVCRCPILTPATKQGWDDWTSKLPDNPLVLSQYASSRGSNDSTVYCEPCVTLGEQHVSVVFCVTCSEYLCQTCYNCHKRLKINSDHTMSHQSVLEYQSSNSTHDAMYNCPTHNEKLNFFCSEHLEIGCIKCGLKNHRKCKIVLFAEEQFNDVSDSQDFKQALESLDILRKMFFRLIDNRTKTLGSIQQQKVDLVKIVKNWSSFIKEQLNKLAITRKEELEQICKKETILLTEQVVECKSAIAAIETSQSMLIESGNSDEVSKIVVTLAKVSQQLPMYLQKYDRIENRSKVTKIGFQWKTDLEEISQTLGSLGRVSCETPKVYKLSPVFSLKGAFIMPLRVQLNSTVSLDAKLPSARRACNIVSGVYLSNKRIVLYDEGNRKITLFDKYFRSLSHLHLYGARTMCIVDERTVAISNSWNIQLVSVTDSLEKVRTIDVEKSRYGIASYQQNLIVGVDGEILIYDASYEVSKRIPSFGKHVEKPISVSPDGQRIYYSVQDKIVSMDVQSETLETFESDELKGVVAIMVDKSGIIYCCGQQSNNVVLFTPEGRQICVLLSHENGLNNPIGICLNDRNNKLLVFQKESSEIKIFTII